MNGRTPARSAAGHRASCRVFFALWPEPQLAQTIHRRAHALQALIGGRLMREDTLHLTLAFLGEVDSAALPALHTVGAAISAPAFGLPLDRLGCWRHNRIAWLAPAAPPDTLLQLVDTLVCGLRKAGFGGEDRRFSPHMTLLRKTDPAACDQVGTQLAALAEPPLPPWRVRDFVLVESRRDQHGARYAVLGRWRLDGLVPDESTTDVTQRM